MAVLSSYNNRCCISGIGNIELLEACHIVGWSENTANRTNPQNGLCMNPFFHKAYDSHLIGITPDYTIIISSDIIDNINDTNFKSYLSHINNKKLRCPIGSCLRRIFRNPLQPIQTKMGIVAEQYQTILFHLQQLYMSNIIPL